MLQHTDFEQLPFHLHQINKKKFEQLRTHNRYHGFLIYAVASILNMRVSKKAKAFFQSTDKLDCLIVKDILKLAGRKEMRVLNALLNIITCVSAEEIQQSRSFSYSRLTYWICHNCHIIWTEAKMPERWSSSNS